MNTQNIGSSLRDRIASTRIERLSQAALAPPTVVEKTDVLPVATVATAASGGARAPLSRAQRFATRDFDNEIPPEERAPQQQPAQQAAPVQASAPVQTVTQPSNSAKISFPPLENDLTVAEKTLPAQSKAQMTAPMTSADRVERLRVAQESQKARAPQSPDPVPEVVQDLSLPVWEDEKRSAASGYSEEEWAQAE